MNARTKTSGISWFKFDLPPNWLWVKTNGIPFWLVGEFTTHFRTYFSGWIESDVHWGYGILDFDPWPPEAGPASPTSWPCGGSQVGSEERASSPLDGCSGLGDLQLHVGAEPRLQRESEHCRHDCAFSCFFLQAGSPQSVFFLGSGVFFLAGHCLVAPSHPVPELFSPLVFCGVVAIWPTKS